MRVCIVTPYDLSHEGGVNRHVRGLGSALELLGHQASILGPASGFVPPGCEAVGRALPVPANGSVARIGLLVPTGAVRDYLSTAEFDVVHVHEPLVPGPARHAVHLARAPVVATFHCSAERELGLQRVLRAAVSASAGLSRIDFGIAVSRAAKAFSRAIYRGRTAVIPNGVDLLRFSAGRSRTSASRPPRLLFVGRFGEHRKGFAVLLDAIAMLRAGALPVEAEVIGTGPAGRFAARAQKLGVRFLGRTSDATLADRYRAADVFCAPSIGGESFGMVIAEAMAAGCPVVAIEIPGYVEAARGAALLVPPGDAGALAVALRRVCVEPSLRVRLVTRGRARAEALCWTRVAARVLHVYRSAAARVPAAAALARS